MELHFPDDGDNFSENRCICGEVYAACFNIAPTEKYGGPNGEVVRGSDTEGDKLSSDFRREDGNVAETPVSGKTTENGVCSRDRNLGKSSSAQQLA